MKLKDIIRYVSAPSQVIMVFLVIVTVVLIFEAIIGELVVSYSTLDYRRSPAKELPQQQSQQERIDRARKIFLPDGTIHLINWRTDLPGRDSERVIEISDESSNLLWSGKLKDQPYRYLWEDSLADYRPAESFSSSAMQGQQMVTPEFSRSLVVPVMSGEREIAERWRYDAANRYFVGYDRNGGKIGYVGAGGLSKTKGDAGRFGDFRYMTAWIPKDSSSPILMWQGVHRLYQIDFSAHSVKLLFDGGDVPIDRIEMSNWRRIYDFEERYQPVIAVVTTDGGHYLVRGQPGQILKINTPKEWGTLFSDIAATETGVFLKRSWIVGLPVTSDSEIVNKWWQENQNKDRELFVELYRIDNNGDLEEIKRFDWVWRPSQAIRANQRFEWAMNIRQYLTAVSPAVFEVVWRWYYKQVRYLSDRNSTNRIIAEIIGELRPMSIPCNLAVTLLMMAVTFWHAWPRRTSWVKFVFWLVFAGAFNLAGLLTYLALNHTTVIHCEACGKQRSLNRPDCPACEAVLPKPGARETDLVLS